MIGEIPRTSNGEAAASPAPEPERHKSRRFGVYVLIAVIAAAIGAASWMLLTRSRAAPVLVTAAVARGDLSQTVMASGTVNAQNTVMVGTQVSGTIQSLYVDYNSPVRTGEVLAQLDPSQFQAALDQAQFSARAAAAALAQTQTQVTRDRSALRLALITIDRDAALLQRGYIAQSQYDSDANALTAAQAALRSSEALVTQSSSALASDEAAVRQDALNLQRTTIVSPLNGTVVARNVSVGQTVAASFQTPTLFTIAQDLTKMEIDISVGEPDIGGIRRGSSATFTVLAYPNRTFNASVAQVRINPTTVNNVVTYTVVLYVANRDNALLPGMTANAAITVARVHDAAIVPLQALTYRSASMGRSPWGATGSGTPGAIVAGITRNLYVARRGTTVRVPVRVILVSGMQAAIEPVRGTLAPADRVVVGDGTVRTQSASNAQNPTAGFGRMIR